VPGSPVRVVAVHDPLWLLKLAAVALILAVPLTIGAHVARARRSNVALTYLIAVAALFAGHYVAPAAPNVIGVLIAIGASSVVLFLGVKYLLIARPLPALLVALATEGLLFLGLVVAVAVRLV
jgi:hypothetical protein